MDPKDTFDKESFARLLAKAKGARSINKYAEDSGVSAAHISRFLRMILDTPPNPETISKLAAQAHNEVSYRDLMVAAGHISISTENESAGLNDLGIEPVNSSEFLQRKGRIERLSPQERRGIYQDIEKKYIQIILSHLYEVPYKWNLQKPEGRFSVPDMVFDIDHDGYKKWIFEFRIALNDNNFIGPFLYHIYGRFATIEFNPTYKTTIVVNTKNYYDQFFKRPPISLKANLYVMLIDIEKGKIVKEEKLCDYA